MNKRNAIKSVAACAFYRRALQCFFPFALVRKVEFRGIDVTGAEYARDLPLTDHNGQQRSLKDFAGKVVVNCFSGSHSAPMCPTSMQELAEVKRSLGADGGDRLQRYFVTVDPERDTAEVLKASRWQLRPNFLACVAAPSNWPPSPGTSKIITKGPKAKQTPATRWIHRWQLRHMTCRTVARLLRQWCQPWPPAWPRCSKRQKWLQRPLGAPSLPSRVTGRHCSPSAHIPFSALMRCA